MEQTAAIWCLDSLARLVDLGRRFFRGLSRGAGVAFGVAIVTRLGRGRDLGVRWLADLRGI